MISYRHKVVHVSKDGYRYRLAVVSRYIELLMCELLNCDITQRCSRQNTYVVWMKRSRKENNVDFAGSVRSLNRYAPFDHFLSDDVDSSKELTFYHVIGDFSLKSSK